MNSKYYKYINSFENFPKDGVIFWDFTPLLEVPEAFDDAISDIADYFENKGITKIAAIEAKGFIIGGALALKMKKPLFLIRKPELTPGKTLSKEFKKEYGIGNYQVKDGSFNSSDNVLIIYDILAGPGATGAAISLIESQGADIAGCAYIIELEYLKGRDLLKNYDLFSLVKVKDQKLK